VTDNEILLLAAGVALGAHLMNAAHMVLDHRAMRRSNRAARRQARLLAADHYLTSLRLYRLQHRSPV
jgi:uncharacterized ferredoxin-like protein